MPKQITQDNAAAAAVCMTCSVLSIFGVNMMKETIKREAGKPEGERASIYASKLWWTGFLLQTVGAVGDAVAVGIGSVSLVAALGGATTLSTNVLVARFWHLEPLARTDLAGVFSVIAGAVLIAVQTKPSPHLPGGDGGLHAFYSLFVRPSTLTYWGVLVLAMVLSLLSVGGNFFHKRVAALVLRVVEPALARVGARERRLRERVRALEGVVADVSRALQDVLRQRKAGSPSTRAAALERAQSAVSLRAARDDARWDGDGARDARDAHDLDRWSAVLAKDTQSLSLRLAAGDAPAESPLAELMGKADLYIYAACSGIWGSASLLLMSVVSKTFLGVFETGDVDALKNWETYVFVALMVGTVVIQTRYLNKALGLGDIMTVYPVFMAFWVTMGTVGGSVLYHDFATYTGGRWRLLLGAIACMLAGVYFLYLHPADTPAAAAAKKKKDDDGDGGDGDDGDGDIEKAAGASAPSLPAALSPPRGSDGDGGGGGGGGGGDSGAVSPAAVEMEMTIVGDVVVDVSTAENIGKKSGNRVARWKELTAEPTQEGGKKEE